jgi:hypothetical protein
MAAFRYIKDFDTKMQNQNQHIYFTLDNFSGHNIQYKPQNIRLVFFEPNMTSFVQPLVTRRRNHKVF